MSSPESVSSRMASRGSSIAICRISLRFFSPPEKPSLTLALEQRPGPCSTSFGLARGPAPGTRRRRSRARRAARRMRVQRRAQEVHVADAGDLDRVLEGQEHARARALLGCQRQQVLAVERHAAAGDLVALAAGQHVGQRALARAVGSHDGVHLARADVEVEAVEDLCAVDLDVEVLDLEHRSCSDVPSVSADAAFEADAAASFLASTANSIGSSSKTSRQKPLTIMRTRRPPRRCRAAGSRTAGRR